MILSVIITSYNFSKYIKQCVDSVLSQKTDFKFEILIRDDFSNDGTESFLKDLYSGNEKIRILSAKENLGPYGNVKLMIDECRGKYISHIDGDDYLTDPYKFQRQVYFLETHPDFIMHSVGYRSIEPGGEITPNEVAYLCPLKFNVCTEDLLDENIVGFGRTFRNTPGIIEGWMMDTPYLDWAMNFGISLLGKIRCGDWPGGIYRHSPEGMFSLKSDEEKAENNKKTKDLLKFIHSRKLEDLVKPVSNI